MADDRAALAASIFDDVGFREENVESRSMPGTSPGAVPVSFAPAPVRDMSAVSLNRKASNVSFNFDDSSQESTPRAGPLSGTNPTSPLSVTSRSSLPFSQQSAIKTRIAVAHQLFPVFFSLFCFGIFLMPLWTVCWYIATDLNAVYWLHPWVRYGSLLPLVYVVTHIIHTASGKANKPLMFFCVFGSGIFLIAAADWTQNKADKYSEWLGTMNCDSWVHKSELEDEWQMAEKFFVQCIEATVNRTGMYFDQALQLYRIRDCAGYERELQHHPDWFYLGELEEQTECAGWCFRTMPLWTQKKASDVCHVTVADIFHNKIRRACIQVKVYMSLVTILATYLAVTCPDTVKRDVWQYW